MTRVALIFGGQSPEHEVSIVSARFVDQTLSAAGFKVVRIGIDREGGWHAGENVFSWLVNQESAPESAKRSGLVPGNHQLLADLEVDVVFPLIHGVTGEDGVIQGYCEMLGLPFVGGGPLNQSLCWDKIVTRTMLAAAGLPQPKFVALHRHEKSVEEWAGTVTRSLNFPVFVKPSRTGSSIGISKVNEPESLIKALEKAFDFDYRVIVEEGLKAREMELAGLGAADPLITEPGELIPENDFYDFEEKYIKNTTQFHLPAELPLERVEAMKDQARTAWRALNCFGMARIDFLVTEDDIYLNEINTIPGFTAISMYPRLAAQSGIDAQELMKKLVELAMERSRLMKRSRNFSSNLNWYKG